MTHIENLKQQITKSEKTLDDGELYDLCREFVAAIEENIKLESRAKVKVGLRFLTEFDETVYTIYKIEGDTACINWERDKIGVRYRISTVDRNLQYCWKQI